MARFDLTFKGTILPDHDPEAVRNGFAELFTIKDPFVLEQLFSGETFVVRSNLDRKSAADYFRKVVELGGQAELVASSTVEQTGTEANGHDEPRGSAADQAIGGSDSGEILVRLDDHVDQSWAVSAARNGRTAGTNPAPQNDDPEARARAEGEAQLRSELTELRMSRDGAESLAADELAQLQKEQGKAREQYEKESTRVRVMREQAAEKGQQALDSLHKKIEGSLQQFTQEIEQLEQGELDKNQGAEQALEELIEAAKIAEQHLLAEAEQLAKDKLDTASKAEGSIHKLEQLIDETRRQAESDLNELDTMLQANHEAVESHRDTFTEQREDIIHQSAEDSDLLTVQLEECRTERDKLQASLAEEQEQAQTKSREAVEQLEDMESEVELRWDGELDLLQQQVLLTQRKLEKELETLAAEEAKLRQTLSKIHH